MPVSQDANWMLLQPSSSLIVQRETTGAVVFDETKIVSAGTSSVAPQSVWVLKPE